MKKLIIVLMIVSVFLLTACTQTDPIVGNDKDEHGCIGSAGYTWCVAKQKCLRGWEEPCEYNLTDENRTLLVFGGIRYLRLDENTSILNITDNGTLQTIITDDPWDLITYDIESGNISTYTNGTLDGVMKGEPGRPYNYIPDENGCYISSGYEWCENKSKCLRPWEERCVEIQNDSNGCMITPYHAWCEEKQKCIHIWEEYCNDDLFENLTMQMCNHSEMEDVSICGDVVKYSSQFPYPRVVYKTINSTKHYEWIKCPYSDEENKTEECQAAIDAWDCEANNPC